MTDDRARDPASVEYGELPELTRALRALGSARRSGGAFQSQFFFPLLEARKRAAEARSPLACIRAFNAMELNTALARAVERIVAGWHDERPSVRRALRAELLERVAPYSSALAGLGVRAGEAISADETTRLHAWRGWTTQLAATFEAADRSWISLQSVVDVLPTKSRH